MFSSPVPTPESIARLIDHTLLKPDATPADVTRLCDEAARWGFWSVCVNPVYVRHAALALGSSPVKVCSVVGFPLGAHLSETKVFEAGRAIDDGAAEVDVVIRIGALLAGDHAAVFDDIAAVVDACRRGAACCKVILENALLNEELIAVGCRLSVKAGADFVKTSTGFGPAGARVQDVARMSRLVRDSGLGVKAAGGIRTYADLVLMVDAGATRVGTSSGVRILEEARADGTASR